jgi:uncharacterized protein (TIGR02145 family)
MRHLLSSALTPCLTLCLALLFAFQLQAQTLSSDNNNDGCVNLDDILNVLSEFGLCSSFACGDLLSHEGYSYSTVQIGDQCWFSENCRYLPEVSPSVEGSETEPFYYVYGYQGTDVAAQGTANYATYGVLYNWPAVMTEGICPSDWHIPTDGEWQTMEISLGMSESEAAGTGFRGTDEGYQMKSFSGWNSGGNGSNSSGFNGLPGGYRYPGGFDYSGGYGNWWSASESGSNSWLRSVSYDYDIVYRDFINRDFGFSARCVRDYTDECGVLNGDNSTCADDCGVPNGDNSTCLDECGVPNGDNSTCLDECGVPNGDNSSCADCAGVANGTSVVDWCGTCDADASNDCASCGDLVSHEGYDYSTVQIGDQCWFAENCRYLPEVSPSSEGSETEPFYYVYGYQGTDVAAQATANYATYGVLYNWPAVMTEGICPSDWHIPTDGEWQTMEISLGMSDSEAAGGGFRGTDEGYQMKSFSGWNSGGNGSNSSGFNGLPGGYRYFGDFNSNGYGGYWWSASDAGSYSWLRRLDLSHDDVYRDYDNRYNGFSARCVRD